MTTSIIFKAFDTPKWVLIVGSIFIPVWFISTIAIFSSKVLLLICVAIPIIIWQTNLIFASITINERGITYKSWFLEVFIAWQNVKSLGGIVRIERQFFEVIDLKKLISEIKYKSQLDKYIYPGEVRKYLFISTKKDFSPNRFSWVNEQYIHFEYRPEIIKIIQEKLEAIDSNV
ncbi:MAG: hypothetical protein V4585_17445 [Bacteroidota bacterium]|jgi:hypothetical protein